ncbi:hypothetical protein MKW92_001652, partial [Papaver armeniacum]
DIMETHVSASATTDASSGVFVSAYQATSGEDNVCPRELTLKIEIEEGPEILYDHCISQRNGQLIVGAQHCNLAMVKVNAHALTGIILYGSRVPLIQKLVVELSTEFMDRRGHAEISMGVMRIQDCSFDQLKLIHRPDIDPSKGPTWVVRGIMVASFLCVLARIT